MQVAKALRQLANVTNKRAKALRQPAKATKHATKSRGHLAKTTNQIAKALGKPTKALCTYIYMYVVVVVNETWLEYLRGIFARIHFLEHAWRTCLNPTSVPS